MATKGSSILTFKCGDIIFRTEPARRALPQTFSIYPSEIIVDYSFRKAMELVDVKNNLIYLRKHQPLGVKEKTVFAAKLELFWNNWALVEPEGTQPTLFPDSVSGVAQPCNLGPAIVKGEPVYSFTPGDIIIMVKPPRKLLETVNTSLSLPEIGWNHDHYRKPMELLDIKDNIIHLKYKCRQMYDVASRAGLDFYENNWALFQMPEGVEHMHKIVF